MSEIFELFKQVDLNNIWWVLLVSIVLIVIFAGCIGPFFASGIETVLMSKEDALKRLSLIYVILFVVLGVINYMFVLDSAFILVCGIASILVWVLKVPLWIFNKLGKFQNFFSTYKETAFLSFVLTLFPVIAYIVSNITGIKLASCVILCALAEIIIIALTYLNQGEKEATIFIKLDKEKWYVFRRMDSNYLLCGDRNNISESTKIKLLDLNTIVESNTYFEKDNSKSK